MLHKVAATLGWDRGLFGAHRRRRLLALARFASSLRPGALECIDYARVVDVEDAVEVVGLVLERLAEEAFALDTDLLAVLVAGLHHDRLSPLDPTPVARYRQTAFVELFFADPLDDLRIDQDGQFFFYIDHRDPQRHADLRRRQSDAR